MGSMRMVMYAGQSCFNFSVSFYKEVISSELGFIKLNLVALRKEGLREASLKRILRIWTRVKRW